MSLFKRSSSLAECETVIIISDATEEGRPLNRQERIRSVDADGRVQEVRGDTQGAQESRADQRNVQGLRPQRQVPDSVGHDLRLLSYPQSQATFQAN